MVIAGRSRTDGRTDGGRIAQVSSLLFFGFELCLSDPKRNKEEEGRTRETIEEECIELREEVIEEAIAAAAEEEEDKSCCRSRDSFVRSFLRDRRRTR